MELTRYPMFGLRRSSTSLWTWGDRAFAAAPPPSGPGVTGPSPQLHLPLDLGGQGLRRSSTSLWTWGDRAFAAAPPPSGPGGQGLRRSSTSLWTWGDRAFAAAPRSLWTWGDRAFAAAPRSLWNFPPHSFETCITTSTWESSLAFFWKNSANFPCNRLQRWLACACALFCSNNKKQEPGNMADLGKKYCVNCLADVTNLRLRCTDCPDIELCPECFSAGAEIGIIGDGTATSRSTAVGSLSGVPRQREDGPAGKSSRSSMLSSSMGLETGYITF
ncbi:hypothetical protein F7725_004289 [Dissostichus mawsoni]|uniref:ZZ-type domain-containing protein n=1 Tax=Dissostichus mawsoni TaxID=36200 RepID=A0A7J5XIA4_DISMA|nr:hypothetical protein F7725_004289 [Dissostichus mawsoni]